MSTYKLVKAISKPDLEAMITNAKVIGSGTYGIVYEAIFEEQTVAVKVSTDKSHWEIEKKVLMDLDHPNIVSLLGQGEMIERYALVLEYMPYNLEKILTARDGTIKLSWSTRVGILQQLASALNHVWVEKQYVIGDLKPDNILLDETCTAIKICDFGSARKNGNGVPTKNESYAPPELIKNEKGYAGSDVFSYGTILLQMITKNNVIGETLKSGRYGGLVNQKEVYAQLPKKDKKKNENDFHISARARVDMHSNDSVVNWEFKDDCKPDLAIKITQLGIDCTENHYDDRPKISTVVTRINEIL